MYVFLCLCIMFHKKDNQMDFVDCYVERRMRRWFRTGRDRYVGLAKTHTQHLLEAIAYNLYRATGIMSNCQK